MSVADSFTIVATLTLFIIVAVATGIIWDTMSDAIQTTDVSAEGKQSFTDASTGWGGAMDWLFAALLIGLPLISMGLAYFIDTPPIFFYTIIGLLLIMVFIGWGFQTAFENIISTGGVFADYITNNMPITHFIMNNFGMYSLFIIIIIGTGTYVKQRGGYNANW